MKFTEMTFKAKVNDHFTALIGINVTPGGREMVSIKLTPSAQYGTCKMTLEEFDEFLEDLKGIVHSNTIAAQELAATMTKETYTID